MVGRVNREESSGPPGSADLFVSMQTIVWKSRRLVNATLRARLREAMAKEREERNVFWTVQDPREKLPEGREGAG